MLPVLDEETDLDTTCSLLGIKLEDLLAELDYRRRQKATIMHREMVVAARSGGTRRILRDRGEGGGEQTMMIHKTSYHYWGQRLGYECWDDPQFVREYLRDNPTARVRSLSNRTMLTVDGLNQKLKTEKLTADSSQPPAPAHSSRLQADGSQLPAPSSQLRSKPRITGRGRWSA